MAVSATDTFEQVFEVRASPRQTHVETIIVKNDYNTFAPFQCAFTPTSSSAYTVTPEAGTMNRRSGEPIEVVVRYKPMETGVRAEASHTTVPIALATARVDTLLTVACVCMLVFPLQVQAEGELVFETEDMKKVYKFIGST